MFQISLAGKPKSSWCYLKLPDYTLILPWAPPILAPLNQQIVYDPPASMTPCSNCPTLVTHIFDGVSEPLQKAKTSCETRDDGLKLYAREWLTVCPDRTADCDRSPEEAFKLPGGDQDDKSDLDFISSDEKLPLYDARLYELSQNLTPKTDHSPF